MSTPDVEERTGVVHQRLCPLQFVSSTLWSMQNISGHISRSGWWPQWVKMFAAIADNPTNWSLVSPSIPWHVKSI